MDLPAFFRVAGRWTGFIGSLATLLLGILHVFLAGAYLDWPEEDFVADVQKATWRAPLFSLDPAVLMETWTPFIVGLCGLFAHFKDYHRFRFISESFVNYFLFNLFEALFATMAFNGGLGIICSLPVWFSAFFSLLALIIDDGPASLDFNVRLSLRRPPAQSSRR